MNSNPYWYKLIKMLKADSTINTGITIPYIFGAYEILGEPFTSIKSLLIHIIDNRIDKYPLLQKCHVIQQHVIMVEAKEICNKYFKNDIQFENKNRDNKLFISSNTYLGKTLEKVALKLESDYITYIENKCFSWCNHEKKWKGFNREEITKIKSLK